MDRQSPPRPIDHHPAAKIALWLPAGQALAIFAFTRYADAHQVGTNINSDSIQTVGFRLILSCHKLFTDNSNQTTVPLATRRAPTSRFGCRL